MLCAPRPYPASSFFVFCLLTRETIGKTQESALNMASSDSQINKPR